ncbi:hypothetical protein [Candidatus Synechococcus spongiarum]|nr:hypothetical protein [Candidatus Synechococcus spongiarum]
MAYAEFFELQDGDFTVEPLLMGHSCNGCDSTMIYASMDNP